MQGGGDQAAGPGLFLQHLNGGGLRDAVLTDRRGSVVFSDRQPQAGTVAPDGTAVEQVPGLIAQTLDQRGSGVEGEADQVDDDIGLEAGDTIREGAITVFGDTIRSDLLYVSPVGSSR
jgi:hypothetical protein